MAGTGLKHEIIFLRIPILQERCIGMKGTLALRIFQRSSVNPWPLAGCMEMAHADLKLD
jgi:hypothetical protein